ncbi:MAG TPA: hypothetical protein VIO57_12165 [Chloroflexota bacterium]|jgi:hypothetical protein
MTAPPVFGSSPYADARVLITVKTYPTPSAKYIETVCTAGVTDDGRFIRLYPIPYRMLQSPQRYKKYQWVRLKVQKRSADSRPESYSVDEESIEIENEIGTAQAWKARRDIILPLRSPSIEDLRRQQQETRCSLGLVRPARVSQFRIVDAKETDWTDDERAKLTRTPLFRSAPYRSLEKIPFEFRYQFTCDDPECNGHDMQVLDWEVAQSYRQWSRQYGARWREAMEKKYADELVTRRDLHFYVGTVSSHPATWTIIGLFYPPLTTDPPPQAARPSQVTGSRRQDAFKGVSDERPVTQARLPFEAEETDPST